MRFEYWTLTPFYSLRYCKDCAFRDRLLLRMHSSSTQLALALTNLAKKDVCYVSALGGVHTLDLSDCQGITDVSALWAEYTP